MSSAAIISGQVEGCGVPLGSSAAVGRLRLTGRTWSQLSTSEYFALLHLPFEKSRNTASVADKPATASPARTEGATLHNCAERGEQSQSAAPRARNPW